MLESRNTDSTMAREEKVGRSVTFAIASDRDDAMWSEVCNTEMSVG